MADKTPKAHQKNDLSNNQYNRTAYTPVTVTTKVWWPLDFLKSLIKISLSQCWKWSLIFSATVGGYSQNKEMTSHDNEPDYVTTAPPPASPTKTISVGNNAAFPGKRVLQVNHVWWHILYRTHHMAFKRIACDAAAVGSGTKCVRIQDVPTENNRYHTSALKKVRDKNSPRNQSFPSYFKKA